MKKAVKISALFLITLCMLFAFCGCTEDPTVSARVVHTEDKVLAIEARATGGSLADALNALQKSGDLTFEGSASEYGLYISSINGYTVDSLKNEYWAIYTTLGDYKGVPYSDASYGTREWWEGKTLKRASYGVSGLPLVNGEIYLLIIETF